ncbi:hypothetical protein BDW67DRAFT_156187 [Aspergillus spinulosporus]
MLTIAVIWAMAFDPVAMALRRRERFGPRYVLGERRYEGGCGQQPTKRQRQRGTDASHKLELYSPVLECMRI